MVAGCYTLLQLITVHLVQLGCRVQDHLYENRHYCIRKISETVFVYDAVCGLGSSDRPIPLFAAYAKYRCNAVPLKPDHVYKGADC